MSAVTAAAPGTPPLGVMLAALPEKETSTSTSSSGLSSRYGSSGVCTSGFKSALRSCSCAASTDSRTSAPCKNACRRSTSANCSYDASDSSVPRARAVAAESVPPAASIRRGGPAAVTSTASAPQPAHTRCNANHTPALLWHAFFAEEAADLSLLLLRELQRQMRAQHLQTESSVTGSPSTGSSLPLWMDLRYMLHTAAAAAAAATKRPSAGPAPPQQSAVDAFSVWLSLSPTPAGIAAVTSAAVAPPPPCTEFRAMDGKASRQDALACSPGSSAAPFLSAGAMAPPATAALLCVNEITLRTMLQLLPVVAYKESEELLRCGATAVRANQFMCSEAGYFQNLREPLEADVCHRLVGRLLRMLHHSKKTIASHGRSSKVSRGRTCSRNSTPYRGSGKSCGGALSNKVCNEDSLSFHSRSKGCSSSNSRCSSSARSNSMSHSSCPYTNSNTNRACKDRTTKSLRRDESHSPLGAECKCNTRAETIFLGSALKSLQQLLLQLLFPHALTTAIVWGRQLHLHEQRSYPPRRDPKRRRSSTQRPKQQQAPQAKVLLKNLLRLGERPRFQQEVSREQRRSEWRQQWDTGGSHQKQQPWRRLQSGYAGEGLRVCLEKLLFLLKRQRKSKKEISDKSQSVRGILQELQLRQQVVCLHIMELLRFCSVCSGIGKAALRQTRFVTGGWAERVGAPLENSEVEYEQQPRHSQLNTDRPLPRCFWRAVPAATRDQLAFQEAGWNAPMIDTLRPADIFAARKACDVSPGFEELSKNLPLQLLLCELQLYIHVATPPILQAGKDEQTSGCHTRSSFPTGCCPLFESASVKQTTAAEVSRADAAAAVGVEVVAGKSAKKATKHYISEKGRLSARRVSVAETSAGQVPSKMRVILNAVGRPTAGEDQLFGQCKLAEVSDAERGATVTTVASASKGKPFTVRDSGDSRPWPSAFSLCETPYRCQRLSKSRVHQLDFCDNKQRICVHTDSVTYAARKCPEGAKKQSGKDMPIGQLSTALRQIEEACAQRHGVNVGRSLAGDQCADVRDGCGETGVSPAAFARYLPFALSWENSTHADSCVDRSKYCCNDRSSFPPASAAQGTSDSYVCALLKRRPTSDSEAQCCGSRISGKASTCATWRGAYLTAANAPTLQASQPADAEGGRIFADAAVCVARQAMEAAADPVASRPRGDFSYWQDDKLYRDTDSTTAGKSRKRDAVVTKTECIACREGKKFHSATEGSNSSSAASCNRWFVNSSTLSGTGVRSRPPIVPAVSSNEWHRRLSDYRCSSCAQCAVGHPEQLELSFRPAVVRISLIHTRGSFRSLFKSCMHKFPIAGATQVSAREMQQQQEPHRREEYRQQRRQRHFSREVDSLISIPNLSLGEARSPLQQITLTSGEAGYRRRSASDSACSGAVRASQKAGSAVAASSSRMTSRALVTKSLPRPSRQKNFPHPKDTIRSAARSAAPNACASCGKKSCHCSVGRSESFDAWTSHYDYNLQARQRCNDLAGRPSSSQLWRTSSSCSTQGEGGNDATEREDILVCCFLECGAVTLNGRFVQFSNSRKDEACFPCIVDLLLLSWYGTYPSISAPSSPLCLPVAQSSAVLRDRSSVCRGQYTLSTASTCSSSCGSGEPSATLQGTSNGSTRTRNSSCGRWMNSGLSFLASSESGRNSSTGRGSMSPIVASNSSEQREVGTFGNCIRHMNAMLRPGSPPCLCAPESYQPHVCLLFLAANGTLFCSGDVPSVYLPPCTHAVASSSSKGCGCSCCTVFRNSRGSAASLSAAHIDDKLVPATGRYPREDAASLTAARYGTLYSAIWLPAVCAATRRPLLFGSLLASNTAAMALTSNLLLPRYKGRAALQNRQLSCKLLEYQPLTSHDSLPAQDRNETGRFSLLPAPPGTAGRRQVCECHSGCCGHTCIDCCDEERILPRKSAYYAGVYAEAAENVVPWKKAAAAAGSGAALAVLQAHTGEPVLLQQHRQEAQTAAAMAVWRGGDAGRNDAHSCSGLSAVNDEPSGRRSYQVADDTRLIGTTESIGFSLRFVALPDVRKCLLLQPVGTSSIRCKAFHPFQTEGLDTEGESAGSRPEALSGFTQEQAHLTTICAANLAAGIRKEATRKPIPGAGIVGNTACMKLAEKRSFRQGAALPASETGDSFPNYTGTDNNELNCIPSAWNFLLTERWIACCLYKDLVLLKTPACTHRSGTPSAAAILLTNLEKDLHDWLADFFEKRPHLLNTATYMRLGFERLSKGPIQRCSGPLLPLSAALRQEHHQKQQDQRHVSEQRPEMKRKRIPQRDEQRFRDGQNRKPGQRDGQRRHRHQKSRHDQQECGWRPQQPQQPLSNKNESSAGLRVSNKHHGKQVACADIKVASKEKGGRASPGATSLSSSDIKLVLQLAPADSLHTSKLVGGHTKKRENNASSSHAHSSKSHTYSQSTGKTAKQIPLLEPLRKEVTAATAACSSCDAERTKFIELEEGDGQLRLFLSTEDGTFFCLNLQRRCVEAVWPVRA